MTERWLPVPGFEGFYEVSDQGRVYAHARTVMRQHPTRQGARMLKPELAGPPWKKYLRVTLIVHGIRHRIKVHHLVLLAFVGPRPAGMQALHTDDDPLNNHLSNLRYGTPSENQRDRFRRAGRLRDVRDRWPASAATNQVGSK